MNEITHYRLLVWSVNPDKLKDFYINVLGLELINHLDLPDDYGYMLKAKNDIFRIWVGKHSEVNGKNKDKYRHIINLYVEDVYEWYEKLKNNNEVEIICKPFRTPPSTDDNPKYCFTFLDPEGNCFQFMNP